MNIKNDEKIQVRIDAKTKKEAKKILDSLGIDMSSAIKIFFRQVINTRNLPFEIRGEDGLTLAKSEELREALASAKNSDKEFETGGALIKDALL